MCVPYKHASGPIYNIYMCIKLQKASMFRAWGCPHLQRAAAIHCKINDICIA